MRKRKKRERERLGLCKIAHRAIVRCLLEVHKIKRGKHESEPYTEDRARSGI